MPRERSAYGCKLYCCWCAQDIEANRFWEGMAFVPLAFRAGSAKKDRVHIFWQKRIRANDTVTPWWFPSETSGGMMDAARIALPLPPGVKWTDELPRLLPALSSTLRLRPEGSGVEGPKDETALPALETRVKEKQPRERSKPKPARASGGLYFGVPKAIEAESEKPVKMKAPKKNDPALAAKARELRDRWLEQVNATPLLSHGKYDVSRPLDRTMILPKPALLLTERSAAA